MRIINSKKGFTLIELIVAIAITAILAMIITPVILGAIESTKFSVDQSTLRTLNNTTRLYRLNKSNDPFNDSSKTSAQLIGYLIDEGLITGSVEPKVKGASFVWSIVNQRWGYNSALDNTVIANYLLTSSDFELGWSSNVLGNFTNTIQKNIQIPEYITTIHGGASDGAFLNKGIDSVILSNSMRRINAHAFQGNNLQEITFPPNVIHIGTNAFRENPITKITILNDPSQVTIQDRAFGTGYSESNIVTNKFKTAYTSGGPGTYEYIGGEWVKTN